LDSWKTAFNSETCLRSKPKVFADFDIRFWMRLRVIYISSCTDQVKIVKYAIVT